MLNNRLISCIYKLLFICLHHYFKLIKKNNMKKGLITCEDKEIIVDVPEYIELLYELTNKGAAYMDDDEFSEAWDDAYCYCTLYFCNVVKELLPSVDLDSYWESFCVPKKDDIIIHYSLDKSPN